MKPGFADICAIIWSLAMVVVLALDIVALGSRWHVQWSGRGAGVKSAKRGSLLFRVNRSRLPQSITEWATVTRRQFRFARDGR
jgi:hypothetical protein